jgi:hypothetical protein
VGSVRDEVLVSEVAHILATLLRRSARHKKARVQECQQIAKVHTLIDQSGREPGHRLHGWAAEAKHELLRPDAFEPTQAPTSARLARRAAMVESQPMALPETLTTAVQQALGPQLNFWQALPVSVGQNRRLGRATQSVVRENLDAWLSSEQGLEWLSQREALFAADDGGQGPG